MPDPVDPPAENTPASTRIRSGKLKRASAADRPTCGAGHPWKPETTRWRRRVRNGRVTVERDCLRCKSAGESRRRSRKTAGPAAVVSW
jgi:hypothetical protein